MFFRMRVLLLLSSFLLLPTLPCSGKVTRLGAADRRKIEHPGAITLLRSMRDLPAAVVQACAAVSKEKDFNLAEPGGPFQVTDVLGLGEEKLPHRRLIWAAKIPGYYLVHYESGGFAHSYHVVLVAFDPAKDTAQAAWGAAAIPLADYADFLRALAAGKLDDTFDYLR